jgi:hypothetical protein
MQSPLGSLGAPSLQRWRFIEVWSASARFNAVRAEKLLV